MCRLLSSREFNRFATKFTKDQIQSQKDQDQHKNAEESNSIVINSPPPTISRHTDSTKRTLEHAHDDVACKRHKPSDCSVIATDLDDRANNSREVAAGEGNSEIESVADAIEVCSPQTESNNDAGMSDAHSENNSVAEEDDHQEKAQESDAKAASTLQAVTMFP